jgi:hypothetical protein
MIAVDVVVGVPIGAVPRRCQQLLHNRRIPKRLVGDNLGRRDLGRANSLLEERRAARPSRCRETNTSTTCPNWSIARLDIAPLARHLQVELIDLPAIANGMPTGPGRLGEQAGAAKHHR